MIPKKFQKAITDKTDHGSIFIGTVKSTDDPTQNGMLWVHIPELTGPVPSAENLFQCLWTSPFAGATTPGSIDDPNSPSASQTSYGMWMRPPDPENQVVVGLFKSGGTTIPVVLGCLFQTNRNFMVPGIPAGKSIGGVTPVQEVNINADIKNHSVEYSGSVLDVKVNAENRPMHELESTIFAQGLINDFIRGQSTSGARREGSSEVFGILTPGAKKSNDPTQRHTGHQFVMDDDADCPHIRIRTGGGNQILLNDVENMIYISNKSGTGHIEIDGDGNIDIYGTGSYNVRTSGDMNLRADKDVNIEAGQNVNIKAANNFPHPMDILGTEKGVVDDEKLAYLDPIVQSQLTNGSVNIEGAKDLNLFSNTIKINARPRLKTLDGKTDPGSVEIYADKNFTAQATGVNLTAFPGLHNPPSTPYFNINSAGMLNTESKLDTNIMAMAKTNVNAGASVDIQTNPIAPQLLLPRMPDFDGIKLTDTSNTLLSFERLGLGGYPPRAEQGKSPMTPLILYDKKVKTIITRWVSIEPSPSRRNK